MKKLVFQRKNLCEQKKVVPEVIVKLLDWKDPTKKRHSKIPVMVFFVFGLIMILFLSMAFWAKNVKRDSEKIDKWSWLQYTICYWRSDITYYDKLEDLVLVNPWRKECVTYNQTKANWTWYWSCYDTWCWKPYSIADYEARDKEFMRLVGIRYFIK